MKFVKSSTILDGNVKNIIGQDLSPIANGNSGLFPDTVKTVSQSGFRSGSTVIGKLL